MADTQPSSTRAPCWQLDEGDHHLGVRWLALACVAAGERPAVIDGAYRVAVLGARTGVLATRIADCNPEAEVWAWDPHAEHVEATRRRGDRAGLANLTVHEQPGLPDGPVGEPFDVVVVDQVLEVADDDLRDRIVELIGAGLRPGGVVCVRYHTVVGWTEITPVLTLMRYAAQRSAGTVEARVIAVTDLLRTLRDGDAKYLTTRPIVDAWLDSLDDLDPLTIEEVYLRHELRPLSHAQVSSAMAHIGCHFVGSARLTDELDIDLPEGLGRAIAAAPTRRIQETYRDLAVRRADRVDVFRLASSLLSPDERTGALGMLAPWVTPPATWSNDEQRTLRIDLERGGSW